MFDASLERLSVTETSYNNSLAERASRSTIQTLPATLPEPRTKGRAPPPPDLAPGLLLLLRNQTLDTPTPVSYTHLTLPTNREV